MLGEFIEGEPSQDLADAGDARGVGNDRVGFVHHGAELVDGERRSVLPNSFLAKERRPGGIEPNGERAQDPDWNDHRRSDKQHHDVKKSAGPPAAGCIGAHDDSVPGNTEYLAGPVDVNSGWFEIVTGYSLSVDAVKWASNIFSGIRRLNLRASRAVRSATGGTRPDAGFVS